MWHMMIDIIGTLIMIPISVLLITLLCGMCFVLLGEIKKRYL